MTRLLNIEVLGLGVSLNLNTETTKSIAASLKKGVHDMASKVAAKTATHEDSTTSTASTSVHEY